MTDTGFLNVGLEVGARTRRGLAPLIDAFDGKVFPMYIGRLGRLYRAHYEIAGCADDASATIDALVAAIEQLDATARRAWKRATVRDFNIGVELARGVRNIELALEPAAVARVVSIGGRIVFTAYQEAAMRRATRKATRVGSGRRRRAR